MLIRKVTEADIDAIFEVEETAFISPIRTTEDVIKRRLGLGHAYFGAFVDKQPVGAIALS